MKKVLSIIVVVTILLISFPASAESKPTLKVALLSPPDGSEKRIESMLKQYAGEIGITVDVVYYDTVEEYRESVNMQILTGEGPDILQANAIPYWDYAQRGLLDELGSRIKKEDYHDDLYENIVSGLKDEKGKLYVLPSSYYFHVYVLNEELASRFDIEVPDNPSFKDLIDMCVDFNEKSKDDAGIYTVLGGDEFIRELLLKEILVHIDFSHGVNGLADLDNGTLEYINTVSNLSKEYWYEPQNYLLIVAGMSNRKVTYPSIPSNLMMNDDTFKIDILPRLTTDKPNIYELDNAFCETV